MEKSRKKLKWSLLALMSLMVMASCAGASDDASSGTGDSSGSTSDTSGSDSSSSSDTSIDVDPVITDHVYFKSPAVADTVYLISSTNMTNAEMAMITSVQGILAQTCSRIFVRDGTQDSYDHFVYMQNLMGFEVVEYTNAWDLLDEVKQYLPTSRYVLYSGYFSSGDNYDLTINHAATVSGVEGYIMIDTSLVTEAIEHGFRQGKDVTSYTTRQVFEEYKDQLNPQLILHQNPQKMMLRDYGIAAKAFCCYFDYITDDNLIWSEVGTWADENAPIIGWTENEIDFVEINSSLSLVTLAADWGVSFSFLSGYSADSGLSFPNYQKQSVKAEQGKHYVSFVMSDGDNIQWLERNFMNDTRFYGAKCRGKFPMTWTVSPSLYDMGPTVLQNIYDQGTENDYFIAGPSGYGYVNPTSYNSSSLFDYAQKTAQYMKATGTSVVNFIDSWVDSSVLDVFTRYSNVKGGLWSVGDYYLEGNGGVYWSNDKPFLTVRECLWRNSSSHDQYYGYTERVAQRINNYNTDPTDISGYTVVICHAWSIGVLPYVERCINQLEDHVEVVSLDDMIDMVAENVPHEDVETPNDISPTDLELCDIDSRAIYWKDVKDYPTTDVRKFDFTSEDDLGNWSLNAGGFEYDSCQWDSWSSEGTGSIKLDGSDLNDKQDYVPNAYMYNAFDLTSSDTTLEILCKGGSDADTNFRVNLYYEDANGEGVNVILKDGYGTDATFDDYGYYHRTDGANVTTYRFDLTPYQGQKVVISLEQDDDGDGSGEQIFIDHVYIS